MDSNDRERVSEAREELARMLAEDELRDAVLLVFANKQVLEALRFEQLLSRDFHSSFLVPPFSCSLTGSAERYERSRDYRQAWPALTSPAKLVHPGTYAHTFFSNKKATCATNGEGLYEGLDWLSQQLKNKH